MSDETRENAQIIVDQVDRSPKIMRSLLDFGRQRRSEKHPSTGPSESLHTRLAAPHHEKDREGKAHDE